MLELYLNPGNHIDDPAERLEDYDELDVVFKELNSPRDDPLHERLLTFLAVPLLFLGLYPLELLYRLYDWFGKGDRELARQLRDTYEADLVLVDKDVADIIGERRRMWAFGHSLYLVVALPGFVIIFLGTTSQLWFLALLVLFTLLASAGFMLVFLAGTTREREWAFLSQIDAYHRETGATRGVLIIGGQHEAGIQQLVEHFDSVELRELDDSETQ